MKKEKGYRIVVDHLYKQINNIYKKLAEETMSFPVFKDRKRKSD